jgi:hypothetical protein
LIKAEIEWLVFGGGPRPSAFPLTHGVCKLIWMLEMWAWSDAEQAQKYQQHRQPVDVLAAQAGLPRAWVLDELERERKRRGRRDSDGHRS